MTTKAQIERAFEVGATDTQIREWIEGQLIQYAMPELSDDDREYILTGITSEEWERMFGDG